MIERSIWTGRRVLVTGHTGFKGGWLSVWLALLGARIAGYALPPPTHPSFFQSVSLGDLLTDYRGDIRDVETTRKAVADFQPEVVFHLAAQPLVLQGYRDPIETYATNVIGTAILLDACRYAASLRAIVVVTTDKRYENRNTVSGYHEHDRLGGIDPYSSSKACAELVCEAYRHSFFSNTGRVVGVATARAGNVIGGGDWAADRLIMAGEEAIIRHPHATRPWQHVLEPLHGYLLLAERLLAEPHAFSEAWNFGPEPGGDAEVLRVIEKFADQWRGGVQWRSDGLSGPTEADKLMLDSTKAKTRLKWAPCLSLDDALRLTVDWYGHFASANAAMREKTESQIRYYSSLLKHDRACQSE